MNGLRAERQTTADQRQRAWKHQKTYSGVCYQLVWGLSQNLSSPLLNLFHQQVDYTRHLRALQRCVFSACALATVVIEKSDNCRRCCAKKCPFVDSCQCWRSDRKRARYPAAGSHRAPSRRVLCSSARGNWAVILKRERKRKELERWR